MLLRDVVVAALGAQLVRLEQHVGVRVAVRRLEAVRRELDQQAERVVEVDRVHEPAVLHAAVLDPALVEALDHLVERRLRDCEREVMDASCALLVDGRVAALPLLVREDGDQAPVAGIEVQVALRLVVEVRLLEDERHPEDAFPEIDRRLPFRPDERDVVDALAFGSFASALDEFGLVLAALQGAERQELDLGLHGQYSAKPLADRTDERIVGATSRASSTLTGSGGSCFTPAARGRTSTLPLTAGANSPTTSRTAAGKTLTPRTISMSSVRPRHRIRGAVRPQAHGDVRTTTWSRVRNRSSGAAR